MNEPAFPTLPALIVGARQATLREADGAVRTLSHAQAGAELRARGLLVCHAPAVAARLRLEVIDAFDLLELFAFVRPAQFCLPTARGLAEALELPDPVNAAEQAACLQTAAKALLQELQRTGRGDARAVAIARIMGRGQWRWAAAVLQSLEAPAEGPRGSGLDVWNALPEWEQSAPEPPPGTQPIDPLEARQRLADLLGTGAEARPSQSDYASAAAAAFAPREAPDEPHVVLAEAGTGVGKTLGYVAPASLWSERNNGPVWISTYTRNLQRQIDGELDRLFPDPEEKKRKVVIRKGRENYLCLLNYEEAVGRVPANAVNAIGLGLLARWALATRDGDIQSGDLPAWLADIVGRSRLARLADQRGECIYSSCAHYSRCFIERTVRRARRAEIVVANHALVMAQAAMGGLDDNSRPVRYVFDEGHHIFDAADAAFAAHLTGQETADLRRWLLGAEGTRGSRARGLERRLVDLLGDDEASIAALRALLAGARALPSSGWIARLGSGLAQGPAEEFLALVRQQVLARAPGEDAAWGQECEPYPPIGGLLEAADKLADALNLMIGPLDQLRKALAARLDDEAKELETAQRNRIEALGRSLRLRAEMHLKAWRGMLADLREGAPQDRVDWFSIERIEGREIDLGYYRHWRDPTLPFAEAVLRPAHGAVVTSATLRDSTGEEEKDWLSAEWRTGARHLTAPALRAAVPSPFDYATQTRVYIVADVARDNVDQVAAAYRELFLASGGGALGLFTAIRRLRAVHGKLAGPLEQAGIPLYAQHVDGMDTATLVDIFRAEDDSCLLGTDAVRDGVDVPGRSLRLIVFDRVPWPRPDILHKARRAHFLASGIAASTERNAYDDMLTRFRLKQAFGRLIRRATDQGVFVILDQRTPTRLLSAFPVGVPIARVGLKEAIAGVREFLHHPANPARLAP